MQPGEERIDQFCLKGEAAAQSCIRRKDFCEKPPGFFRPSDANPFRVCAALSVEA
jgi:hypothetical protein